MTLHNFDDADRFVAHGLQMLTDSGIKLEVGTDFEQFRELLKEARPDHILGDPMEPKLHDLNVNNAVWVVGRDDTGQIMHTQALRMINTRGLSLAEYLRHNFRDFPPSGVDLDLRRSRYRAAPTVKRINGSVCYHGEYWIGKAPREFGGNSLSSLLCRYAFWEAMNRWDPDYLFAFMQKSIVMKGHSARTTYMHIQPGALRWFLRGNDTPVEGFLAHMERDDMRFMLEMPLVETIAQQPKAA